MVCLLTTRRWTCVSPSPDQVSNIAGPLTTYQFLQDDFVWFVPNHDHQLTYHMHGCLLHAVAQNNIEIDY